METGSLFFWALQSSVLLGLIHGVNPCGHSWLVLLPFVSGERNGMRVVFLTTCFLLGTTIACILLGVTIGSLSMVVPPQAGFWLDITTSVILILLGVVMTARPHLLHNHHHTDGDHHTHDHHHQQDHHEPGGGKLRKYLFSGSRLLSGGALFVIGFVNMIIPCPTVAIMYGYGLNSGSVMAATTVFFGYALATAVAVGLVIFLIFRVTTLTGRMQKDWVEPVIMRVSGAVVIVFSCATLYATLNGPA